MQQAPLIALLTDFGLVDPYVAQMRSVLLAVAPCVPVLDISHDVAPQDIVQAAFFLSATLPWLPPGSVICAVVDPGVGTSRRVLLAAVGRHCLLAPDNGLLTLVLGREEECRLYDATPRHLPRSATFHGRDVFAPLAGRLAMGEDADDVAAVWTGPGPVRLEGLEPECDGELVTCRVLSVDRFGNIVLSLDLARFERPPRGVSLVAPVAAPLARALAYADIAEGAVGILAGSQGYLELATSGASASALLGIRGGDRVTLHWPLEA